MKMIRASLGFPSFEHVRIRVDPIRGWRDWFPSRSATHRATDLHRHVQTAQIESDLLLPQPRQIEIPVQRPHEKAPSENVTNCRRDHRFPDVHAYAEIRVSVEDGVGKEVHVGDNVIETEGDEGRCGPPNGAAPLCQCHLFVIDMAHEHHRRVEPTWFLTQSHVKKWKRIQPDTPANSLLIKSRRSAVSLTPSLLLPYLDRGHCVCTAPTANST